MSKNVTLDQAMTILGLVQSVPAVSMQQLIDGGYLDDLFSAAKELPTRGEFRKVLGLRERRPRVEPLCVIPIPAEATVEELTVAGEYKHLCPFITSEHYEVRYRGNRELWLAGFGESIVSEIVLDAIEEWTRLSLADPEDLLALGAYDADLRCLQHTIVCLGSPKVVGRSNQALVLYKTLDGGRGLDVTLYDRRWDKDCRFLLVRKSA